jgi:hypothetical protein
MQTVIKDSDGNVINIGEWDYQVDTVTNDDGTDIVVELNPMPEGAYEDNVEVVTGWDGGLYEANDPRRLKQ